MQISMLKVCQHESGNNKSARLAPISEAAHDNVIHKESGDNQFHAGTDYKTDENAD